MNSESRPPPIRIAAALVIDADNKLLLVRKRDTTAFMQPGGKIEPGEVPVEALRRELCEELGLVVPEGLPTYLGRFSALAAHEPGRIVEAEVFRIATDSVPIPAAEIEEAVWVDVEAAQRLDLAPLTRDHLLPLVPRRRIASQPGLL